MIPMLAVQADDLSKLHYPVVLSPKFDGIRAITTVEGLLTRQLKRVPNDYTQAAFNTLPPGMDGELIVGKPTAKDVWQKTSSGIMSKHSTPDVTYHVFDVQAMGFYEDRLNDLIKWHKANPNPRVRIVPQVSAKNIEAVQRFEAQCQQEGYEGIMIRSPQGVYKHGRSTVREGYLLKRKLFMDSEAEVLGFEEKMHNGNEAKINATGHTERSSHKENLVPLGVLGALRVRDVHSRAVFNIGTGFDDYTRKNIWLNRNKLLGKLVTYKYQPAGVKELPRFPVFKGFRID